MELTGRLLDVFQLMEKTGDPDVVLSFIGEADKYFISRLNKEISESGTRYYLEKKDEDEMAEWFAYFIRSYTLEPLDDEFRKEVLNRILDNSDDTPFIISYFRDINPKYSSPEIEELADDIIVNEAVKEGRFGSA